MCTKQWLLLLDSWGSNTAAGRQDQPRLFTYSTSAYQARDTASEWLQRNPAALSRHAPRASMGCGRAWHLVGLLWKPADASTVHRATQLNLTGAQLENSGFYTTLREQPIVNPPPILCLFDNKETVYLRAYLSGPIGFQLLRNHSPSLSSLRQTQHPSHVTGLETNT